MTVPPNFRRGPGRYRTGYVIPGIDSPRAIASAQLLLSSAVSVAGFAPDWLAHQYRLSGKQAEAMLGAEKERRVSL